MSTKLETQPTTTGPSGKRTVPLTRKDFISDQMVRWCPGCGDYSVLAQMHKLLPTLGIPREQTVFVSGIGCSSRFPYYVNTYGIHGIHGRAPAIASGVKAVRPDLSVWVVTGDGDGLSIGGNHLIHLIRRNLNIKVLLFDNRIYGLTKGQYSPTSVVGQKTKSTPMGSIDFPLHPIELALGAEATFVARAVDTDLHHITEVMRRAAEHKGCAFVQIYQDCPVFNDGAFDWIRDKNHRMENGLYLTHGQPIRFGKDNEKGIILDGITPKIVTVTEKNQADLLVHDERAPQPTLAFLLSRMTPPNYPVPLGVLRAIEKPTYEVALEQQIADAKNKKGEGDMQALLLGSEHWTVD